MSSTGRIALVTGSSSGIGAAVAVALANAGYDIIVNYSGNAEGAQSTVERCRAAGRDAMALQADVSDEQSVESMMEAVRDKYGRLDVLCNNAGTSIDTLAKDYDKVAVEDFDRVMAVNVRGLFLVAKHARPLLEAGTDAAMVNTASIVGLRPGPQPLPYLASKAAIVAMTQSLCLALGPDIRVNAVAPGWLEGEWMEWMLGDKYEKLMSQRAKATPLKRCCTVEDVAEVVTTLVTQMRFVTGETIVVDGGFARTT